MIIDLTGHKDKSVAEKTNISVTQLLESEAPRIVYPINQNTDEHSAKVSEAKEHYFGKYTKDGKINSGATFSLKGLNELPKFYVEKEYGIMFLEEKTNTGFTIHIVEPTKYETRPYDLKTLTVNLITREYTYSKNGKEYKTSYTNIDNFFDKVGVLGIRNVLFVLSPREYPMFYYDMYSNLSTRRYETANYIGRFFERLLTYKNIEVLYKSGLPNSIVNEYARTIIDNEGYRNILDDTQTSARMMLKIPKPLWKMALKGYFSYRQLQKIYGTMVYIEKLERDKYVDAKKYANDKSFESWVLSRLPKVTAFKYHTLIRNLNHKNYPSFKAQQQVEETRGKKYKELKLNRLSQMNPKVLAYYKRKYAEYKKEIYNRHLAYVEGRRSHVNEGIKYLSSVIAHTNALNKLYGINHTKHVLKGEGVAFTGSPSDRNNSAIGIHIERGFDLKRLVMYIYYECPLDQGYNLRGFSNSTSKNRNYGDGFAFTHDEDSTYVDYLDMVSRTSKHYERYPKHLKTAHDIAVANMNLIDNEETRDKLHAMTREAKKYEEIKVPRAKFLIKVPDTVQDFVEEGNNMGNCIGGYVHSVLAGTKDILFMRHVKNPDKARVNIEVRDGAVVQIEGRFRARPTAEEYKYIQEFAKHAGLEMKA